jgi:hypothetical protein
MSYSSGCTKYELAIAKITFWDGPVRCETCPCMEVYQRKQCRLTGEYLSDTRGAGHSCPLIPIDDYSDWADDKALSGKALDNSERNSRCRITEGNNETVSDTEAG